MNKIDLRDAMGRIIPGSDHPRLQKALDASHKRFKKRFGRDPLPGEPVMFDPDAPGNTPVAMNADKVETEILKAMEACGAGDQSPALVYIYVRTGFMPSPENRAFFSNAERAEMDMAVEEYKKLELAKGRKPTFAEIVTAAKEQRRIDELIQ
jgi:hypothetical protein